MAERQIGLEGLPNLRQLRCFALVVKHGGIGRAAEEIGMSQPAASHAISRLEDLIGTALLVRHPGGSTATRAGELLAVRIGRFLGRLEHALSSACGESAVRPQLLSALRMVHLRAHIAIAETGTFTRAARRLGVSAPALHRAARDLEQLLPRRLYRVGAEGIGVNAAGDALAQQMRLALQELAQAFEEMGHRDVAAPAPVTIGILPLMPKRWVARRIARAKARHPEARVELREGNQAALLQDLRRGDIDLIIGALPPSASGADVIQEPLFADPYVLVVRRGHPLADMASISPEMLAKHDWVVPSHNVPRRIAIERFFATLPVRPRIWLDTSSPGTMMAVLAETDCITLVSRTQLLMDGPAELSVLPVEVPHGGRMVGLTRRKDWLPTPVQQAFLNALSETTTDESQF